MVTEQEILEATESRESAESWVREELGQVALGDKRIDWRLVDTAGKLAAQPRASIPQACDDWADTKATYRLFDNEKVSGDKIRAPHMERTRQRLKHHERVLAIQDTSYLDYTPHPETADLGPIGTEKQDLQGLVMHTTMFATQGGLPLGLGSQKLWVRPQEAKQETASQRRKVPIEDKESYKWLEALSLSNPWVPDGTQVVHVADSESDIFELFVHAQAQETDLLVRAAQNRRVCEPEVGRLWEQLGDQPIQGELSVSVPARNQEPARTAQVSVRFCSVRLDPPQHLRDQHTSVPMDAILVREEAPPEGATAIEWLLLTTVSVPNIEAAYERIEWYCQRWQIEVYHKVLKSGCRVEDCQLATADRLKRCIALYSIIAWRLFWLTHLSRHAPDAPCTAVLAEAEWRALYARTHRSHQSPDQLPTVRDVTLWIAQLGGFLARKGDGHPGVTVIWRGWTRLTDLVDMWLVFNPP